MPVDQRGRQWIQKQGFQKGFQNGFQSGFRTHPGILTVDCGHRTLDLLDGVQTSQPLVDDDDDEMMMMMMATLPHCCPTDRVEDIMPSDVQMRIN